MQVWQNLEEIDRNGEGCALTIGTFDGVHRGHQWLVEELKREAQARDLASCALTFQDMPFRYFRPEECSRLLTLPEEKASAFGALGIDGLAIVPFDDRVALQSARDFVRSVVVERLRCKYLLIGPDFALGKGRAGNAQALKELGREHGFEVRVLGEKLLFAGEPISSTRARACVEDGHLKTASEMLGRAFEMQGAVVSGDRLGRRIGVPTINIAPHERKVLPAHGVYACRAFWGSSPVAHLAALNIGTRPTVDGSRQQIEFNVIDEDIAQAPPRARLQIIERLRGERRFGSVDELVEQMKRDIDKARLLLQSV
jgi:riboflavin kinase/FMN adenylyltransferase